MSDILFKKIPGGKFTIGANNDYPEEGPKKEVEINDFYLSETTVTNAQFSQFVEETGYVTVAEKELDPRLYPGVSPDKLIPGSAVFKKTRRPVQLSDPMRWWRWVPGTSWREPLGPESSIEGKNDHPVVHIAYPDATAFAAWAGGRLPTEEEWEVAARGLANNSLYAHGDTLNPDGDEIINRWVGGFPFRWQKTPGRPDSPGTVSVKTFPANDLGLYEMCGNVWEWTSSFYTENHQKGCCSLSRVDRSRNPESGFPRKTLRGGSFLCAENYCRRFRVTARIPEDIESATNHIGFRIAQDL